MGIKGGINGFGRIGRNIMRAAMQNSDANIEFVAVNDITNPETLAHLLKYDSVLGNLSDPVNVDGDGLRVGDSHFKVLSERDPGALPWAELGVDIVLESTGLFTKRDDASKHLAAGASKVIIYIFLLKNLIERNISFGQQNIHMSRHSSGYWKNRI